MKAWIFEKRWQLALWLFELGFTIAARCPAYFTLLHTHLDWAYEEQLEEDYQQLLKKEN